MNMALDDYDGQVIPGDESAQSFQTVDLQLTKTTGKNLNQEINQTGEATTSTLDRNGG